MEGSKAPLRVEIWKGDIREPHMGTLMPIKAWIYLDGDKIVTVDLENDESIKTTARLKKVLKVSRDRLDTL